MQLIIDDLSEISKDNVTIKIYRYGISGTKVSSHYSISIKIIQVAHTKHSSMRGLTQD